MKRCFLILVSCSCWVFLFSQNKENTHEEYNIKINSDYVRGNKEFRATEGDCNYVIKLLQSSFENDSMAIDVFKKEYQLVNMPLYVSNWLFKQNHTKIIHFFTLEGNKKYYCRSRRFRGFEPVLLMD